MARWVASVKRGSLLRRFLLVIAVASAALPVSVATALFTGGEWQLVAFVNLVDALKLVDLTYILEFVDPVHIFKFVDPVHVLKWIGSAVIGPDSLVWTYGVSWVAISFGLSS